MKHTSVTKLYGVALYCVSPLPDDSGMTCGHMEDFVKSTKAVAMASARFAGWTFRKGAARCKRCGREGRPFGKAVICE